MWLRGAGSGESEVGRGKTGRGRVARGQSRRWTDKETADVTGAPGASWATTRSIDCTRLPHKPPQPAAPSSTDFTRNTPPSHTLFRTPSSFSSPLSIHHDRRAVSLLSSALAMWLRWGSLRPRNSHEQSKAADLKEKAKEVTHKAEPTKSDDQ